MIRVIADTNIILSGLFFDKNPEKFLLLAIDGKIKLILPQLVIDEVNEKIREKFGDQNNLDHAKDFWFVLEKAFKETSEDLKTTQKSINCADSDDEEILEYSSRIDPDYFISGNRHVLEVTDAPFPIIKLTDFLKKEFPNLLEHYV